MPIAFNNSLNTDRRLFRSEIRASIAHCNGLFRAGILTRPQSERLKNGLWTILKRADFDRNYFDNANSPDIFSFIASRLFQLVHEEVNALEIARSRPYRAAAALRLWLRDEIELVLESLENLSEVLHDLQTNEIFSVFAESFRRDEERFREAMRRTNQMPCPKLDETDEAQSEIDFQGIAHELGFESVLENPLDAAGDRDFCVEYVNSAALTMLHLSNLSNTVLAKFYLETAKRQVFETIRGKAAKIFGHQAALLILLKNLPIEVTSDLDEVYEIVFETTDILKSCLQTTAANLKKIA